MKLSTLVLLLFMFAIGEINADEYRQRNRNYQMARPLQNKQYNEECGACHFAYPPGLLPESSWRKLLSTSNLLNHFGEELEISDPVRNQLVNHLSRYSADRSRRKIIKHINKSETSLRITETRYFKYKHRRIPLSLIADNHQVESLSDCIACHNEAENGVFDDDTVMIPGYGRWEDD